MFKFIASVAVALSLLACRLPAHKSPIGPVEVNRAVVKVEAMRAPFDGWTGTATFIGERTALTAGHVCDPEYPITLHTSDGDELEARIVAEDDEEDWCVLETVEDVPDYVTVAWRARPKFGDKVWYVGYPGGMPAIYEGRVSGFDGGFLVVSIVGWFGASGSSILNEDGQVVGILSATYTENGSVLKIVPVWMIGN